MRAFFSSLLTLFLFVFLAVIAIAYGYPEHPMLSGTFLILGLCASVLTAELVWGRGDLFVPLKQRTLAFLREAKFPALWGATAAYGFSFGTLFIVSCTLTTFLTIFVTAFVLAFAISWIAERLLSGSWRISY